MDCIPASVREYFKTAWELPQRRVVDMAVERMPFVDGAQSLDVYLEDPSKDQLVRDRLYCR